MAAVAMAQGVNANLLRTWIAAYQRRSAQVPAGDIARMQDAAFVAVRVEGEQDQPQRVPQRECAVAAPAMGVSVEELIGEPQTAARKRGPAPKLMQHVERISALPKTQQRTVMNVIEAMLAQQGR